MEKKSTGLILIIVVLALLLGLLGGYVITDKIINKDKETSQGTQNNNENKGNNSNVEQDYSLSDAEKLMSNYKFNMCGTEYLEKLDKELMATLAIMHTNPEEKISCDELKNDGLDTILYEQCLIGDRKRDLYKYDSVLSTYKKLFGSLSVLSKESFKNHYAFALSYYYSNSKQGFAEVETPAGGDCQETNFVGITSAKIINNNLEIVAYNKDTDTNITNTHKYTFKKENGNYYLAEIKKINN